MRWRHIYHMPLKQGSSQAVAIAERVAGKSKNAATAAGGANTSAPGLETKKYDDQDEYVVIPDVPIFDSHSGEDEGLDLEFTPEVLQQIIDRCNERIKDTGDLVPITDRHTSDDPNDPEPDLLGFAHNFRLGDLGKVKPRQAIYCDMRIHRTKLAKAKSLPRRSIELWVDDLAIDPVVLKRSPIDSISLLGSQRPARDLGLMFEKRIHKNQKLKARYSRVLPDDKENMNPEEVIKQVLEAIQKLPEFEYIRECMKKDEGDKEGEQFDMDTPAEEQEEPVKESKKKFEEDAEEKHEHEEVGAEERDLEPAKLRLQRDQERRRYAKLESEHKALFAKVAEMEKKSRVAERTATLLSLEGEGIVFDMAEELEVVSDMAPTRFEKHLCAHAEAVSAGTRWREHQAHQSASGGWQGPT